MLHGRSLDELWVRSRQEVAKRIDAMRFRLQPPFSRTNAGNLPISAQRKAAFFFDSEDLFSLSELLRKRLPEAVTELITSAERICRHEFDLLGYAGLDYGAEIDWHLEVVHGKRAPLKPWFQIRYLDFEEVGDVKIIWELNRHQHLSLLARAYNLTGREEFAAEIFRQWYHWWQQNPYPFGVNWASSLEVAFRALSWLWVGNLVRKYPSAPRDFSDDLMRAVEISGRHIERFLSTYFSPNTHLLGEGVALFFIGTLCPQLRGANRWQRRGWEIVLREASRQVQADGTHFEQSVYYHVYALDFFLHARMLAAANRIPIPLVLDQTLEKMLMALTALSQCGSPPRFGDDDGGRVFDSRRNRTNCLVDPLAVGAAIFERADFKASSSLCEEAVWLLGKDGIAKFDSLPAARTSQCSVELRTSGIYVMRDSGAISQQVVVDAGPLGTGKAGHGHADALSLCLTVKGREWLIDPGTYAYVCDGGERDLFRGTSAHNTLVIDELSQAEPVNPFAWRSQPDVRVETWVPGERFALLVGSHSGYTRLSEPVIHRRLIFQLNSRFCYVLDKADGRGFHKAQLSWHINPGSIAFQSSPTATRFVAEDQSVLEIVTVDDDKWKNEITAAWQSPAYGQKVACPVLRCHTQTQFPISFATLLLPGHEETRTCGQFKELRTITGCSANGHLYATAGESHYFMIADGERWTMGPWSSDAKFLYCRIDQRGVLRHLVLCSGSFVEREGERAFSARRALKAFEWMEQAGENYLYCLDKDAIEVLPAELDNAVVSSSNPAPEFRREN